jgi:hypothetical protein
LELDLAVDREGADLEAGAGSGRGDGTASTRSSRAGAAVPDFFHSLSLSLFRMLMGKCPSGQRGERQGMDKGLKLGFIKIIIELKSLCFGLICCCNFIFGLLRILLGFFLCYLDFLCVIWVFFVLFGCLLCVVNAVILDCLGCLLYF